MGVGYLIYQQVGPVTVGIRVRDFLTVRSIDDLS